MAISKIILNGVTQMDLTGDTVEASNLIAPNTAHGADGEAIVGTATAGGGGEVNIGTVTMTHEDETATSIQFTGLKGTPKAFFVRCVTALSRSTSSRNYYVVTIRYNGTDTVGNRYYRYNGQYNIVTSGYSYTYSGGTLTLTSSGSQTTSPGSFYSGGYELVYIY